MRIRDIIWDTVTITCEEDPSKDVVLHECEVVFDGSVKSVKIFSRHRGEKSHAYPKAELLDMRTHMATFKACWFSAKWDGNDYDELIPVKIHCVLNDAHFDDYDGYDKYLVDAENKPRV